MKEDTRIDCIIPAAGTSSRMGSWKPMLPYRGLPLIAHVIDRARAAAGRIIVVTGYRAQELTDYLEKQFPEAFGTALITCENRDYSRGMFSSIQTGLAESRSELSFIVHADLPDIDPRLFSDLLTWYEQTREQGPDVIRPVHDGVPGHPVLITAKARRRVLDLPPEGSMQQAFTDLRVVELAVSASESVADIDTPEAYEQLIRKS